MQSETLPSNQETSNHAMKRIFSISAVILATAFLSLSTTTTHAGKPPSKGKKKGTATVPVDTNDRISVVHLSSITVHHASTQQSKEYQITPQTKITINGMEGKISGLTTGMDVTVTTA